MDVRLTQLDGKLPNLALMRLGNHHRARGDVVHFSRSPYRSLEEPAYGRVYGSAIFSFTAERVAAFRQEFPDAIVGGTWDITNPITVEDIIGAGDQLTAADYDYSLYPEFDASLGFTQRGCRFKCGFCVVPKKEGRPQSVAAVADIWRGEPQPRHLHLLDNDFFGQPREHWEARVAELRAGRFKVCLNQGINIRMIDNASAAALKLLDYRDDQFQKQRIYTAWDNIGDEKRFFTGIETLAKHGIPPSHVMAYMLVGYDRRETWERLLHRFNRMAEIGIRPYPMIYNPIVNRFKQLPGGDARHAELERQHRTLGQFQRWANGRFYTVVPFAEYRSVRMSFADMAKQGVLI